MHGRGRLLSAAEAAGASVGLAGPGIGVAAGCICDVKDEEAIRGKQALNGAARTACPGSKITGVESGGGAEEAIIVAVRAGDCASEAGRVGVAASENIVGEAQSAGSVGVKGPGVVAIRIELHVLHSFA